MFSHHLSLPRHRAQSGLIHFILLMALVVGGFIYVSRHGGVQGAIQSVGQRVATTIGGAGTRVGQILQNALHGSFGLGGGDVLVQPSLTDELGGQPDLLTMAKTLQPKQTPVPTETPQKVNVLCRASFAPGSLSLAEAETIRKSCGGDDPINEQELPRAGHCGTDQLCSPIPPN